MIAAIAGFCVGGGMEVAMGVDIRNMTVMQAADKWFEEIERLLKDLDIKSGHLNEQFGLQRKDLQHIIDVYANDWCSATVSWRWNASSKRAIYFAKY
jgi:alcohol dehydrogenase class IV